MVGRTVADLQLEAPLGHGGAAHVYRASSPQGTFAVKLLDDAGSDSVRRLRLEAAALARLRGSGVAELWDAGVDDGVPWLAMELIDGETLAARLERGVLDEAVALQVGIDVLETLGALHALGILHRDIKPENILLDRAGRARLIDLGLSGRLEASDEVVGTLAYASPEQVGMLARPVDARTDLYAVGGVLFACLAGRAPFVGTDARALVQQLAAVRAPLLRSLRPAVTSTIEAIIARLLEKEPSARPASAAAVLDELRALLHAHGASPRGTRVQPKSESLVFGRERELALLMGAWRSLEVGQGALVVVRGEAGMGKTTLLLEHALRTPQAHALHVRCQQSDPTPFAPILALLEAVAADLRALPPDDVVRSAVSAAAVGAEARLLELAPCLADVLPPTTTVPIGDPRELLVRATSGILLALAASAPRVVVVDDAQWLDDASLSVLQRVAAHLDTTPLLLVCAARPRTAATTPADALARIEGARIVALEPLDLRAVQQIVQHLTGTTVIPTEATALTFEKSRGNPLHVHEIVQAMWGAGALRYARGAWVFDEAQAQQLLALSDDVIALILARARTLPARARRLLAIGALCGTPFDDGLVRQVAGPEPRDLALLGEAVAAGLLEPAGSEQWRFTHDKVREAFEAELDDNALASAARALVDAVSEQGVASADVAFRVARWAALGFRGVDEPRVFVTHIAAAWHAMASHAQREATDLFREAFRAADACGIAVDDADRRAAASACLELGRFDEGIALLSRCIADEPDPLRRAALVLEISEARFSYQDFHGSYEALAQAFHDAGVRFPLVGVRSLLKTMWMWLSTSWRRLLPPRDTPRDRLLAYLYARALKPAYFFGDTRTMLLGTIRGHYHAQRLPPSADKAATTAGMALLFALLGLRTRSARVLAEAQDIADVTGDPGAKGSVAYLRACLAHLTGDTRGTVRAVEEADPRHGRLLAHDEERVLSDILAIDELARGNALEAFAGFTRSIARGEERAHHGTVTYVAPGEKLLRAQAQVALGELEDARVAIERVRAEVPERFLSNGYGADLLLTAELALAAESDVDDATANALLARLEERGPAVLLSLDVRVATLYAAKLQHARWRRAAPELKPQALRALEAALATARRAGLPVLPRGELDAFAARVCAEHGDDDKRALRALAEAEAEATRLDHPLAWFECLLGRLELALRAENRRVAKDIARAALALADAHGWKRRAAKLRERFGLEDRSAPSATAIEAAASSDDVAARQLSALLQVGAASLVSLDLSAQAALVLAELIKLLGAERGLLFLRDQRSGPLNLFVGRDAAGRSTSADDTTWSRTVVQRVLETQQPVVVDTDGNVPALSESILARDLRSIIATPVLLGGEAVGVIYLDSRLAYGLFKPSDTALLQMLSVHICMALTSSRSAQREIERRDLDKEIEVAAAVQSLFLPSEPTVDVGSCRLSAMYVPAAQCGGDWWWHGMDGRGRFIAMIGDVTGHGIAPAMVTASILGGLGVLMRQGARDVMDVLRQLDESVVGACRGSYLSTVAGVVVDPAGTTQAFSCAGPPILALMPDGDVKVVPLSSSPLGSGLKTFAIADLDTPPGSLIALCSDGLLEMRGERGRPFGVRRLGQVLARAENPDLEATLMEIGMVLDQYRGPRALEDDVTLALLRVRG